MLVKKIDKVVVNAGIGKIKSEKDSIIGIKKHLVEITGQKPRENKAKKAIAGFKLRQGEVVGLSVTLRGKKMFDFLKKLTSGTLPSIRDFKGLDVQGFDPSGNYSLGVREVFSFPEISFDSSSANHGLQVNIVTNVVNKEDGQKALEELGFIFKKGK